MKETTIETTAAAMSKGSNGVVAKPEFIRLPKAGTLCPWTGLSRSKLNELILPCPLNNFQPPIRSVSLRNRGQVKGVRLVVFDSLIAHLRSLLAEPAPENTTAVASPKMTTEGFRP